MPRVLVIAFGIALAVSALGATGEREAGAAANPWPHRAVSGFSTPGGFDYVTVYADGTVQLGVAYSPEQAATWHGDASGLALSGPIVGGADAIDGKGYWLVASDGGIFSYGSARFFGSMGAARLNQPVFSMASTRSGKGYWLVARDGGIFSFGDATFHGSTGGVVLNQPIAGISSGPTDKGYRLVARDGGIFSFGDAPFYGSLPGRGIHVDDVVGMAPTPTGKGYWIARGSGQVYAFGDAPELGGYVPNPPYACNAVVAIFANPGSFGYRLLLDNGAAPGFGNPPGLGTGPVLGTHCPTVYIP